MSTKKEARNFLRFLRKKWNYSRDLLDDNNLSKIKTLRSEVQQLIDGKIPEEQGRDILQQGTRQIEKIWPGCTKARPLAENIEVIFVALVIAFALRCYFLQPFKIPTDSMKPTLWGIYPESVEPAKLPNVFQRVWDYAVSGKSYHSLIAPVSGQIEKVSPGPSFLFLDTTVVRFAGKDYRLWTDYTSVLKVLSHTVKKEYQPGDVIASFSVQAGDHIFVNKLAYNFRMPQQGEVFVFTTKDIAGLQEATEGVTQYYIKRCVGVPGVTLRVEEPYLYSNGQILDHRAAFERIYSQQNGYHGYVNAGNYMADARSQVTIPEDCFWAMGDNSPNSLDSRYWKYVPRRNLVGTASMVYWPFSKRWGLIR